MAAASPLVYAIDFGTSNSLLGAVSADRSQGLAPLDPMAADPHVLRSLMYFGPRQAPTFGEVAIKAYVDDSMHGRFLRSFKRFLPMKSFDGTLIDSKQWSLEELTARFLREMRERANAHFDQDVESTVLGRPALFSDDEESHQLALSRLETAAHLAGFKHVEFLPEPVAAAYRYRLEMKKEEVVLVADFGGGTSDYTVLKLSQREFRPSDVLAIGGAPLAGDSLDGAIMRHRISKNFGSEVSYTVPFGSNVLTMPKSLMAYLTSTAHINFLNSRENREFLKRVRDWSLGPQDQSAMEQLGVLLENQLGFSVFEAIERAKRALSDHSHAEVSFRYPGIDLAERVSAKQFKEYSKEELAKIFAALDETLLRAGLNPKQVDRVCCTGGTAKVGLVRQELLKRFDESRLENFRHFTSIVEGLGERAQQLLRDG